MDSLDTECLRCHGKGVNNVTSPTTSPRVIFNFADDLAAAEKKKRSREKLAKTLHRILLFAGIFMLTQSAFSLYNRRTFEQAILTQYNQQLKEEGSGTSCSSAELYGFGLFGTMEARGYIHCSDGLQRRAIWGRERRVFWAREGGKAQWQVEATGQRE